jgi:(+)-trans-carveol dehydrogenase
MPAQADVRNQADLDAAVAAGRAEFGPISICVANAGVASSGAAWSLSESQWTEMIDINLNGAWRTCKAVVPAMIEDGQGGSIVVTASTGSVRAFPNLAHYTAAKHGVLGLVKALAAEVATHSIRVNAVLPTVIETEMALSQQTLKGLYPGLDNPTRDDAAAAYRTVNMLPIPWVEASDVSAAIAWLCSDEARYITAVGLPVDAGSIEKHMG